MRSSKTTGGGGAHGGGGVGGGVGGGGGSGGLFRLKFRKPESRSRSAQRHCEASSAEGGGMAAGGSIGSLGSGGAAHLDAHLLVNVLVWGNDEVAAWLESLNLEEYRDDFIKHDIRGAELLTLERRDLKELGIHKVGHIKRIQQGILEIRELARSHPSS